MSFQAFVWAMKQKAGNVINRAVLVTLADHADKDGYCFPSQEQIAEECQCSQRSVRYAMAELESSGLIKRTRRFRKDGYRTSDGIQLSIQELPAQSAARQGTLPAQNADLTGTVYPASILNQSLNQKEEILIWKWTEADGPLLNRISQTDLWAAAEKELGVKAPIYCNKLYFPQQSVDAAIAKMKGKGHALQASTK